MHKNRRITLHQKIGKGIKFNYITSKITLKNVSGIQNVIIYVGTVIKKESVNHKNTIDAPPKHKKRPTPAIKQ